LLQPGGLLVSHMPVAVVGMAVANASEETGLFQEVTIQPVIAYFIPLRLRSGRLQQLLKSLNGTPSKPATRWPRAPLTGDCTANAASSDTGQSQTLKLAG
jgi:hypothetical protein